MPRAGNAEIRFRKLAQLLKLTFDSRPSENLKRRNVEQLLALLLDAFTAVASYERIQTLGEVNRGQPKLTTEHDTLPLRNQLIIQFEEPRHTAGTQTNQNNQNKCQYCVKPEVSFPE